MIGIKYSVIGFCHDLTDPESKCTNFAIIGLSRDLGLRFWVCDSAPGDRIQGDELTVSVLNGLPNILQDCLARGVFSYNEFFHMIGDIFAWSLYSSEVKDEQITQRATALQEIVGFYIKETGLSSVDSCSCWEDFEVSNGSM